MHFKNINIDQVNQRNSDWLIEYKVLNPADTITENYMSIEYFNDIPCLLVDAVTSSWNLDYDIIEEIVREDVIAGFDV